MLLKPLHFLVLIAFLGLFGCDSGQQIIKQAVSNELFIEKIAFDLSQISPEGLIGPTDGLRSVRYEFCIPANESNRAEVQAIDPTLEVYSNSKGRIGCSRQQYLCIGETHQPHWREKLEAIAKLQYVTKIVESFGE